MWDLGQEERDGSSRPTAKPCHREAACLSLVPSATPGIVACALVPATQEAGLGGSFEHRGPLHWVLGVHSGSST